MRIYLPTTLPGLAGLRSGSLPADGTVPAAGPGLLRAHAVTPALREWYVGGDLEELEYAAFTEAAEASLRLLADDPGLPRRRVVVAADVPDGGVRPLPGAARSAVTVPAGVPLAAVASIHVDDEDAEAAVSAAATAVPAADAGDDDARFLLDEAEAHELLWHDVSELDHLT